MGTGTTKTSEIVFVQTAQGITSARRHRHVARGHALDALFLRPAQRVVGHMSTGDFVGLGHMGGNSFGRPFRRGARDFEPGGEVPEDAVVVIREPRLDNAELSYSIDVLDGTVPAKAGPVTLFIDPFGRPLSPVSVCGMRRRERRRDRRGI